MLVLLANLLLQTGSSTPYKVPKSQFNRAYVSYLHEAQRRQLKGCAGPQDNYQPGTQPSGKTLVRFAAASCLALHWPVHLAAAAAAAAANVRNKNLGCKHSTFYFHEALQHPSMQCICQQSNTTTSCAMQSTCSTASKSERRGKGQPPAGDQQVISPRMWHKETGAVCRSLTSTPMSYSCSQHHCYTLLPQLRPLHNVV